MSFLDFGVRSSSTPISTSTQGVQFNPTFINASPNSSTSGSNDAGQSTATRYTEAPVKGTAPDSGAGDAGSGYTGYAAGAPMRSTSLREANPNFQGVPALDSQFQAAQGQPLGLDLKTLLPVIVGIVGLGLVLMLKGK